MVQFVLLHLGQYIIDGEGEYIRSILNSQFSILIRWNPRGQAVFSDENWELGIED
jgi:hypothetical protein